MSTTTGQSASVSEVDCEQVPGPPHPRRPKRTTTVTVELTADELDGLAWAAIQVGVSDRTRAGERALRKVRDVARSMTPQRPIR